MTAAAEILRIEETAAWDEYLVATAAVPAHRYVEAESWAWARLTMKLAPIAARRAAIREPVAA